MRLKYYTEIVQPNATQGVMINENCVVVVVAAILLRRFHFVYPGEGNGTPLQYSCLENPMTEEPDGLQSMGSQRIGLN